MGTSKTQSVAKVARERFDYKTLRPGQREAIESVVEGRDTLVVMPTAVLFDEGGLNALALGPVVEGSLMELLKS